MKLVGHDLKGPRVRLIVIPREPEPIVLKARAVLDWQPAEDMLPIPSPRASLRPGQDQGNPTLLTNEPAYLEALNKRGLQLQNWIVIESLKATEGLTWDRVKENDPETWGLYRVELKEAGFSPSEISYIILEVYRTNSLNESMLIEARESFLAGQGVNGKSTSPSSVQAST